MYLLLSNAESNNWVAFNLVQTLTITSVTSGQFYMEASAMA